MKTADILDLNCMTVEGKEKLQKALRHLKPFRKYDMDTNIPLESIEKYVGILSRKYHIMMQYITPTYIPNNVDFFSCSFKRTDTHKWLGCVYANTLYELYAKVAIKMVYEIKHEEIPEIDWEVVEEKQKEKLALLRKETKLRLKGE